MTTESITPSELSTTAAEPDDAELAGAEALAEQDATGEHVVAFGCQEADRVFLAAVPGQRHMPYVLTVNPCPGCGRSHAVKAMPRPRKLTDEIAVSVEAPPPAKGSGERVAPKSDADVLGAIPDDWTPVADVSRALGYANRGSFTNRLREMRQRGAAIETRRAHRSAPMFVRRAATT